MAKIAIKNENITSFGGIYHIMDVFSKLGFERHGWQATDRSGNDFRHARKCQTFYGIICGSTASIKLYLGCQNATK
jgi:hypothetical protein